MRSAGEVLSRLTALEGMVSSRQQQWEALAHQQATLQTIVKRLTDQAPSNHRDSKHVTADVTDKVQTLAQQLQQLSMDVARMDAAHAGAHARLQGSSEDSLTAYATTELLNAVERKLTERQNRIESALMQVGATPMASSIHQEIDVVTHCWNTARLMCNGLLISLLPHAHNDFTSVCYM